jgi:hypothetical protein
MDDGGTKRCSRCGLDKPLADFARKKGDLRHPYCRLCQAEYKQEHYRKNKASYVAAATRRKRRLSAMLRAAKDQPCADCGVRYPYYVMDLDHRDSTNKRDTFARLTKGCSLGGFLEEITKCDVVCSNCHRQRTFQRQQYTAKKKRKTLL